MISKNNTLFISNLTNNNQIKKGCNKIKITWKIKSINRKILLILIQIIKLSKKLKNNNNSKLNKIKTLNKKINNIRNIKFKVNP